MTGCSGPPQSATLVLDEVKQLEKIHYAQYSKLQMVLRSNLFFQLSSHDISIKSILAESYSRAVVQKRKLKA
jgi:hypothetical protein